MTKPRTPVGFVSVNSLVTKVVRNTRVNAVAKAASRSEPRSSSAVANNDQELSLTAVKALRARFAPKNQGKTSWL